MFSQFRRWPFWSIGTGILCYQATWSCSNRSSWKQTAQFHTSLRYVLCGWIVLALSFSALSVSLSPPPPSLTVFFLCGVLWCVYLFLFGLSYNWWGFKAWDTLQDSTDNSSIDKAETSLDWQEYFSQFQDTTDVLPCHIHLPVYLWIMNPHSRAPKKNTFHGNEMLPQDTTHLIQRPCYQRASPCQDPAGNWTTRRSLDDRKETQTAVVWSRLPFIRSGQNHLARHSERGKKTRRTKEEVGKQYQEMDRPGVRQVPEGSGEQRKNGENWFQNHLWCPNDPHS